MGIGVLSESHCTSYFTSDWITKTWEITKDLRDLVLAEKFDTFKNVSLYLVGNYSHETSKYLSRISLWELLL